MKKWNEMTPAEKAEYLAKQQAEIERTQALLKRFEGLTERWLKNVKAQAAKK